MLFQDLFKMLLEIYVMQVNHQKMAIIFSGEIDLHRVAVGRSFLRSPKLGTESRIRTPRWSLAWSKSHLFRTWGTNGVEAGSYGTEDRPHIDLQRMICVRASSLQEQTDFQRR
jgi:hypothetical protein